MLVLRVLNPQVLQADMAWAAESNQSIPVILRETAVMTVRET